MIQQFHFYLPKGNENTNSKPYLHFHIHSNIINKSQDMKAASVSISGWMKKENMVYTHDEILFSR